MEIQSDHDLLIRVDTNLSNLINEFKGSTKLNSERIADHELRLRRLEIWGAIAVGFMYAVQAYLTFIK